MKLDVKNLFPKVHDALKKVTAGMLCLVLVGLCLSVVGCVKQKNCEEGRTGTFLYLKEPYRTKAGFCKPNVKITAHFIDDEYNEVHYITGTVPRAFQINDSIRVQVCLNDIYCNEDNLDTDDVKKVTFLLECIEKED